MKALLLDIPDLDLRGFDRGFGRTIRVFKDGGSAPATPDYTGAAQATAQGNLDMARLATQANRPNQYTPWGSLEWSNDRSFNQSAYDAALANYNQQLNQYNTSAQNPGPMDAPTDQQIANDPDYVGRYYANRYSGGAGGSGGAFGTQNQTAPNAPNMDDFYSGGDNWTQRMTLSPEMQALFDQQNQLQQGLFGAQDQALGRVNQTMGQGFDMAGIPQSGSIYDPNRETNNAQELLMRRMNPELDRQQSALQAQLANQGITQGSSAYNTAMGQFGQQRNDASAQAALQGIGLGMQQQGLQFGQSEQQRQRAMQEQAFLRSLPLNELNALRTGNQVQQPQFSGFSQQATTGGPDMLGAANAGYQADLGTYNAGQAANSNMMGGLLGIGGSLLGAAGAAGGFGALFSDRRLKTNIKRIGTADNGLPIYSYQYVWGSPTMLGVMADEVREVYPDAVHTLPNGYDVVSYGDIFPEVH